MPRHRPVDYPQIPQTTSQTHLGLAPPQQPWADENRFSWQATPMEAESPNAERELEAANSARRAQEGRKSSVPPLPVLPADLGEHGLQQRDLNNAEGVLPSQRSGQFQAQVRQNNQTAQQQQQQQQKQFRPDIPRNFQQAQQTQQQQYLQAQQLHPPNPTPSYEASQAAYGQIHYNQPRMQEQAIYSGHQMGPTAMSAHAFPIYNQPQSQQPPLPQQHDPPSQHESSEEKPPQADDASQQPPQAPRPVHVGPDANPLSPTSPRSIMSPSYTNTNIATIPPRAPTMDFSQPAFNAQQTGAPKGGTWHHGLSSCSVPTTCLSSLFCPCVVYGRTQHRLSLKSAHKDPTNMLGFSAVNGSCMAWSVLCGVNILLTAIQRTRIRKAYDMDGEAGNVAGDCLKSCVFCCCVVAQNEKEMQMREIGKAKSGLEGGKEGYKSPVGMSFGHPPQ